MKTRFARSIAAVVLITFIFSACASLPPPGTALTDEERESAKKSCIAKYTAIGAVGGAALGYLLGSKNAKLETTAIGAAAGGALAFAIAYGKCLAYYSNLSSFPVAGRQETAQKIGYKPSQGYLTKVEAFSLNPQGVAPGGKVKMNGTYYVMAPPGEQEVKVTETRMLSYYDPEKKEWTDLGAVDNEITSALGTRKAEGNFDIPKDVPEGRYRVTMKVSAQGKEDEISKELMVKKEYAFSGLFLSAQFQSLSEDFAIKE